MIDSAGHDYQMLLEFQKAQLAAWGERVHPHIMADVAAYVLMTNKPAADATQRHLVYRGQDIIELIRTWPAINTVYVAPHKYPSQQDAVEALI